MRNYSNVAEETSLTAGINNSATSITVGSNTGYPSVPYTIIIDPGLATEEVCEVTAVAGTTWTVTRGVDGTPATSHDLGAVVVHGYSARDLRDIQDHIADATGVHGLGASSSVVGTTDTQTLANKTLTAPTINGGSISGVSFGTGLTFNSPTLVTPTIASFVNAQHNHSDSANGGLVGGAFVNTSYKRSGTGTLSLTLSPSADTGSLLTFGSAVHSVGNATWATANTNTRIVLPTDVSNAVWQVTAGAKVTGSSFNAFLFVVHEDLGTIARELSDSGSTSITHQLYCGTDFQSSAGKWLEVRVGTTAGNFTGVAYDAFIAVHRVS